MWSLFNECWHQLLLDTFFNFKIWKRQTFFAPAWIGIGWFSMSQCTIARTLRWGHARLQFRFRNVGNAPENAETRHSMRVSNFILCIRSTGKGVRTASWRILNFCSFLRGRKNWGRMCFPDLGSICNTARVPQRRHSHTGTQLCILNAGKRVRNATSKFKKLQHFSRPQMQYN